MVEPKTCIYCGEPTDEPHFVSDCCGRGMCDNCYDALVGTDEQWQLDYADEEDLERVKDKYRDATYLCFECASIWHKTPEEYTDGQLIAEREQLMDMFTPAGRNWDRLMELLEIERELTLRERR